MAERKVVLLETDDLMHGNTGESNFNERAPTTTSSIAVSARAASSDWAIVLTRALPR
jgi:hypothetical protein